MTDDVDALRYLFKAYEDSILFAIWKRLRLVVMSTLEIRIISIKIVLASWAIAR